MKTYSAFLSLLILTVLGTVAIFSSRLDVSTELAANKIPAKVITVEAIVEHDLDESEIEELIKQGWTLDETPINF